MEREERQVACICHIAELEVAETVAKGYWFLYLRTGYDDALIPRIVAFLPEVLGCSLMEYLIFACNFETFDTFKAVVGSVGVVEMHLYSITYNLHLLEGHALAEESLHAIGLAECLECKTFAYRLFLTWMNLLNLVWVNQVFGTDDAAVWNHLGCIELLFTELRSPIAIYVAIMIRCNLYEIEWQFALLEVSAPLGNEVGKTFGILAVRVAHVRTSLIEENTLYAIVEDRVESSVTPEKRL